MKKWLALLMLLLPLASHAQAPTGYLAIVPAPGGGGGGGTGCVPSGGSATNIVLYGTGGACTPAAAANVSGGGLTLGTAGSVVGSLILDNATSGSITLSPVTGALGSAAITVPTTTGTMTVLGNAVTGSGSIVLATAPSVSSLTVTTAFTATGLVTNADLANPATTVNGQTCTLGSTCTVAAAAGTLTGSTLASTVVTSSLTTVGTIGTGTWQGTVVGATYGGTGVNNGSNTLTLGGSLTTTGAATPTLAFGASTFTYTFPGATADLSYLIGSATSGHCVQFSGTAGGLADAGSACGSGGGGLTINSTTISGSSASNALVSDGTKLQELPYGLTGNSTLVETTSGGLLTASILPVATSSTLGAVEVDNQTILIGSNKISTTSPQRTVTTSPTALSTDMGGAIFSNVSGGGTLTIPTITSTLFASGMTLTVVNYSASTEAVTTTPTVNSGGGCVTATGIPSGDSWQMVSNGTSIDCLQTIASSGTATLTIGSTVIASGTANALMTQGSSGNQLTTSKITDNQSLTTISEAALTAPSPLTDVSTIAVNATLSNNFSLTLTASGHVMGNPTNATVGQWVDFAINNGAGPYTMSWAADYTWAAGSAPTFSSTASTVTIVSCKVITTSLLSCYGPVNSAVGQPSTVSAPTAPNSTSAYTMQGLSSGATVFTPKTTGNVLVMISGTITTTDTAAADGVQYQITYGSGNGPASNAALTGTQICGVQTWKIPATVTAADVAVPFSTQCLISGATIGTAYYTDLAAQALAATGTGFTNVTMTAVEIR